MDSSKLEEEKRKNEIGGKQPLGRALRKMGKVSSEKPCSQIMVRMASDGPKEWTIIELQVISPRGLCPRAVACPQVEMQRSQFSLSCGLT